MAKKRAPRVEPSSDGRQARALSSTRRDRDDERGPSSPDRTYIVISIFFLIVGTVIAIVVYQSRRASSPSYLCDSYLHQRGLVKIDIAYQEILAENSKVSENRSQRHYTYPVLGYITPWNSKGYEIAKEFNSKFTHLSPVWYDLKSQQTGLVLEGRHNADKGWISDLRKRGDALVLPRVVVEASPVELLTKKKQRDRAISMMVTECKEMGYDGIVLESWSRWAAYGILQDPRMRNMALEFIKQLGHALHSEKTERNGKQPLQLVYVIGPPYSEKLTDYDFGPTDLESLSNFVDGFSLMTYDFSSPHNPGPNAPLKWIHSTLQLLLPRDKIQSSAHKIFLGLNFYGNDFLPSKDSGGGAITGKDYLSLLEKHRPPLQWEKNSGEHFFFYTDDNDINHAVFYPTLMSIFMRLQEAHSWGCGISIWEIGQGLDYFYGLL